MSKGAGSVERRIADLLAATRDRALGIDDITDHAFGLAGAAPTRVQRLSATRAAHRVIRRTRELYEHDSALIDRAHARTKAAIDQNADRDAYQKRLQADPDFIAGCKLTDQASRVGTFDRWYRGDSPGTLKVETDFWCATPLKGRLYFHPPDAPVRVWAVSMGPGGITWVEATVTRVTERNVMVRYRGVTARLDRRELWRWWAFWRRVLFVSSRTGRIAAALDQQWWQRYGTTGSTPPSMQMPLAEAMTLLGVPPNYAHDDHSGDSLDGHGGPRRAGDPRRQGQAGPCTGGARRAGGCIGHRGRAFRVRFLGGGYLGRVGAKSRVLEALASPGAAS